MDLSSLERRNHNVQYSGSCKFGVEVWVELSK